MPPAPPQVRLWESLCVKDARQRRELNRSACCAPGPGDCTVGVSYPSALSHGRDDAATVTCVNELYLGGGHSAEFRLPILNRKVGCFLGV